MKALIVFTIVALLVVVQMPLARCLTDEQQRKVNKAHEECKEISKIGQDSLHKLANMEFPEDPKLKSQLLCVNKKLGVQNEDGTLNLNNIRAQLSKSLPEAKVNDVIAKCGTNKATPEDTAYEVIKCGHNEDVHFHVRH